MENFLEYETIEGANQVDLNIYTFLKFSERRQCYIFKKRNKPLKEEREICHSCGALK